LFLKEAFFNIVIHEEGQFCEHGTIFLNIVDYFMHYFNKNVRHSQGFKMNMKNQTHFNGNVSHSQRHAHFEKNVNHNHSSHKNMKG